MRALLQRVRSASVSSGGELLGSIGPGLLVFLGVAREDEDRDAQALAKKVASLRLFPPEGNSEGATRHFERSLLDVGGELLVVSQFTLLADTRKGRRPSFADAASPERAELLYETFLSKLRERGLSVKSGRFQAYMQVEIHNDGPVTIMLESR